MRGRPGAAVGDPAGCRREDVPHRRGPPARRLLRPRSGRPNWLRRSVNPAGNGSRPVGPSRAGQRHRQRRGWRTVCSSAPCSASSAHEAVGGQHRDRARREVPQPLRLPDSRAVADAGRSLSGSSTARPGVRSRSARPPWPVRGRSPESPARARRRAACPRCPGSARSGRGCRRCRRRRAPRRTGSVRRCRSPPGFAWYAARSNTRRRRPRAGTGGSSRPAAAASARPAGVSGRSWSL